MKYICVQPDDDYFKWQIGLWLESLRNIGESDKAQVLLFTPSSRKENDWSELIQRFPEASFFRYYDPMDQGAAFRNIYLPSLRPFCLYQHFKKFPELEKETIFYCDADILFLRKLKLDNYLKDNKIYLSNTNSYINSDYFESKIKDVIPEKLEDYKKVDVLNTAAQIVGITREICEKNKLHSGGAQYLLKNISADFWLNIWMNSVKLVVFLKSINKEYFESEAKGIQVWCSDMWAILWELWKKGYETEVVPELDFAHATDLKVSLLHKDILHNAGVTKDVMSLGGKQVPTFNKLKYKKLDPFQDSEWLNNVFLNEDSQKYCFHTYLEHILSYKNKYSL